jgi:hypothetical protein
MRHSKKISPNRVEFEEPLTIGVPTYIEAHLGFRLPRSEREISRLARQRALRAHAFRSDGFTYAQIGELMGGVTLETARQAVKRGERELLRYAVLEEACGLYLGRLRTHAPFRYTERVAASASDEEDFLP